MSEKACTEKACTYMNMHRACVEFLTATQVDISYIPDIAEVVREIMGSGLDLSGDPSAIVQLQ